MIELLVGYLIGKGGWKNQSYPEKEEGIASPSIQNWSSYGQDTRSFEQLLQEAKEHHANKNNQ
jgi:hypothetical protein